MEKFLERDISVTTGKEIGAQSNNIEKDSGAVYIFLSNHVVGFIASFVIVGIYLVLMLRINMWLGLLSVVLLPLTL